MAIVAPVGAGRRRRWEPGQADEGKEIACVHTRARPAEPASRAGFAARRAERSVYVDAHEPCLGARRAKLSLQYASKIKSLPKHPAHNAVFDNKYMKLFDARPNAIRTFGLRIKQFLTASNIELSDILETPSYFISPPWCIKPPKIVLELVHLKKDRTDASIYQQLFMEIQDRYRDHIPVYTDGSRDGNAVACATVFPSNTVISMRLPDSASVFTAEVWAIIKALKQIKISTASKYIVFTDSRSCLQALHHMKLEHPLIGMVIRKCLFKYCQKIHCFLLGTQPYWH